MKRALILLVTCVVGITLGVTRVASDPLISTLTYPTNGAIDVATGQTFQWQPVGGAQTYYLYVGTTLGAKDVINTGELPGLQWVAPSLPDSQLLYARLWTKYANVWRYSDSTFTSRAL